MPDYERLERLGAGNFGEVWLVYDRALAVQRAVKFVNPDRIQDPTNFYQEPQTLMALRHKNIVRVEDAGRLPNGSLYIAMEYLRRGSVESVFRGRPVPLVQGAKILCDLCWGLEYAHNQGYIHRDIKPANILLGPNEVAKLSDFGLAVRVPRGETASPYGYLTHVAPEVFSDNATTTLSDVYALGVTAYRLTNGDGFLPQINDVGILQDAVLAGEYPERNHYRPYVPAKLRRIINKCMAVDPDERYQTASAFRRQLEALEFKCDWKWRRIRHGVQYATSVVNARITVQVKKLPLGRFVIETKRRVRGGQVRSVSKDCDASLSASRMKVRIRQILSRYITDGR